jgi:hypothetical protein
MNTSWSKLILQIFTSAWWAPAQRGTYIYTKCTYVSIMHGANWTHPLIILFWILICLWHKYVYIYPCLLNLSHQKYNNYFIASNSCPALFPAYARNFNVAHRAGHNASLDFVHKVIIVDTDKSRSVLIVFVVYSQGYTCQSIFHGLAVLSVLTRVKN